MLAETKLALRVTTTAYDAEISRLLRAGAVDLCIAGVNTPIDTETITDDAIKMALITYVCVHFGSPEDYERLKRSYDEQKAQLQSCIGYGLRGDDDGTP